MSGNKVKYSVLELNGVEETEGPAERDLQAIDVDVDDTAIGSGFDDVQNTLEFLRSLGGGGSNNQGANNLFNSEPKGEKVEETDFSVIATGLIQNTGLQTTFSVVAEADDDAGSSTIVRLYDVTTASVLSTITFTETQPTLKSATFTAPSTPGRNIVEVQAKKIEGSGRIYTAEIR